LQHVFGVGRAAGNPMGSAKNASVVRLEESFHLSRGFGYKSQWFKRGSLQDFSPEKTFSTM
jgi:hypothetical protein